MPVKQMLTMYPVNTTNHVSCFVTEITKADSKVEPWMKQPIENNNCLPDIFPFAISMAYPSFDRIDLINSPVPRNLTFASTSVSTS